MGRFRALWLRLLHPIHARRMDEDFAAELDAHLSLDVEAGMRSGLTEAEARRQAMLRLGGVEQSRQAHRDRRGLLWLEHFVQDLRFGARTLRRAPGFTITAVLTLGLGIGACTAIFSLVNAVLLRSLPYGDPERLVYLFSPDPHLKIPPEVICPSYGDFYDLKRESRSYADMSSYEQHLFNVGGQGAPQHIGGARVDEGFFSTLASVPEMGRALGPEDQTPDRARVVVISHSLWASMFGADRDVFKRTLQLDGASYRIVGVMPPHFEYPFRTDLPYGDAHIESTHIWVPLALDAKQRTSRDVADNVSIARLSPGVSIAQAQAEMSTMMARLDKQYTGEMRGWGALVESFTGISIGPVRPLMRLLLATVGLVLLIACGNAANLLLARSTSRARELGVRAALGAGRARMARQLLTESLLICVGGGLVGIALAFLFLRVLPLLDPGNIPRLHEASLDSRVLLFTVTASLFTALLTGMLPAMNASRLQLTESLRAHAVQGRSSGHSRLQSFLIVVQTAMVMVLLAAAGLLIRSYINVATIDTGFSRSTVSMNLSLKERFPQPGPAVAPFFKNVMDRIRAIPGVEAAGAVSNLPLSHSESLSFAWVDGFANQKDQMIEARSVTPGYFSAMQIPLLSGRAFTEDDVSAAQRPVIINQQFARTYFPHGDAIGGRISFDEHHSHWSTVIGVVADVRHTSLEETPQPQSYGPVYDFDSASIAVRTALPPSTLISTIRATLQSIDPTLALSDVHTMGDLVSEATAQRRFQTSLLSAFAIIALVLALVGLYGMMAYSVNRRTRELGIRMALGAQRSDVLLLVLRNAAVLVGVGVAAGLACSWIATRAMRSFLFGVGEHDPATTVAVSGLILACGLVAAFLPARRAAAADPVQALRTE